MVEVVLVPAMLLDGAEGTNVAAGQAEKGLGALDWPEEALILVQGEDLPPYDSAAPVHLKWAEHETVFLLLSIQ